MTALAASPLNREITWRGDGSGYGELLSGYTHEEAYRGISDPPSLDYADVWSDKQAHNKVLLAMKEVERLNQRAHQADEERRRCLETTRNLKGPIRIMGRVRPPLQGEENDTGCLRVLSKQQLEVMTEPRALLTDQLLRNRRRTSNNMSKSLSMLSEADVTPQAALEPKTYFFDDMFDAEADDDDIFTAVRDELDAAVEGEVVCILAYGATGSGKTHTVTNLAERTAKELERQAISLLEGGVKMEITVQIVEIYNDKLRDLLSDARAQGGFTEPPKLKLSVSESGSTLLGASSRTICTESGGGVAPRLAEALRLGQAQRATSSTAVHGRSSRSHLVMTLLLSIRDITTGSVRRSGKLSLVDLAGSERLKRSEAVGERLKEAQHINRSLSALADVISAKERRDSHVPYRNSKLTQLLQDALGGAQQSRTVVIVALPPTRASINDTLHSLQFSSRLTALALPQVARRSSLKGPDAGLRRFPSVPSDFEGREQLLLEVSKWRSEYEKVQAQADKYRTELEMKEQQLKEVERRNAELVATTQAASQNFERSRAQIFNGFAALNQRIQDVVETSLDGSNKGSRQRLVADVPVQVPSHSQSREEFSTGSCYEASQEEQLQSVNGTSAASRKPRSVPACTSRSVDAGEKSAFDQLLQGSEVVSGKESSINRGAVQRGLVAAVRSASPPPKIGLKTSSSSGSSSQPRLPTKPCPSSIEIPTPARAHLNAPAYRFVKGQDAAKGVQAPAETATCPPATAIVTPSWMEQPKRPSWAAPTLAVSEEQPCAGKASPIAFELSPSPSPSPSPLSEKNISEVPVFALSPRAVKPWPMTPQTARGPRSTKRAEEASHAVPASWGSRSRSQSGHRKGISQREYVVEVISDSRARELSADIAETLHSSKDCPPSPALLLCPALEDSECGDETIGDGVLLGYLLPHSRSLDDAGSVSASSDEGEIRDRLKQSLKLTAPKPSSTAASKAQADALAVKLVQAVETEFAKRSSSNSAYSSRPAQRGRRLPSPIGSAPLRSPTARVGTTSPGARSRPTKLNLRPQSYSPPPRSAVSVSHGSRNLASNVGGRSVQGVSRTDALQSSRTALSTVRQYAPVLNRRSFDWLPSRR